MTSVDNEADAYLQRKSTGGRRVIEESQNMSVQFFRGKKKKKKASLLQLRYGYKQVKYSCERGDERGQTNGALLPCQHFEIPGFTPIQFCSGPNCKDKRTVDYV